MKAADEIKSGLAWWQLSLLGVACTLGTGFFLGSGIGLAIGGASLLAGFLLAGLGTYCMLDGLLRMTAAQPQHGTFRSYVRLAYGEWAGFSSGWLYWGSQVMIMGSQLAALSLFTRFWLPAMPDWVFAIIYAALAIGVILLGAQAFERSEHIFALVKVAAVAMFLLIASAAVIGWLEGGKHAPKLPLTHAVWLPNGLLGAWSSLLYAFYAFGGAEMLGLFVAKLREPEDVRKASHVMLILMTALYVLSLFLALTILPLTALDSAKSPFQTALDGYPLPFVPHIFTAILIIAAFSTLAASFFAVTAILVALAKGLDAPAVFLRQTKGRRQIPYAAVLFTALALLAAVVLALLLPEQLYTYISTAAGLTLLVNWLFILAASGKLLPAAPWSAAKRYAGMLLILTAIVGAAVHPLSRTGFAIALLFICGIALITWLRHRPKRQK